MSSTPQLALSLSLDVRGIAPSTPARAHLVAEVRVMAAGVDRARPPLSAVLAIDASGSMQGPPLEQVVQSIEKLVGLLSPTDRVGVVAFSDNAAEVAPLMPVDEDAKRLIARRARRLVAEGGTNLEAGLMRAAAALPKRAPHERQAILLLSDGAPNRGKAAPQDLAALARSFRPDVTVTTLGYGAHHHEDVLARISDAGAGRYHFISDPVVCDFELAQAIGAQGDVVAEAISLSLVPAEGVEIVRLLGKHETRVGGGGLRVSIPDQLEGARYLVVAEVTLAPGREAGPMAVAKAVLDYRPAGEAASRSAEARLEVLVRTGDLAPDPAARVEVQRARAEEARAEARGLGDRGQFEGAAAVLRRLIDEIEGEPGFVGGDGSPLSEAVEQLRDEALAMERKPSQEQYRTFRRSMLDIPVSSYRPDVTRSAALSHTVITGIAGKLPVARLVVEEGEGEAGKSYPLDSPKIVLGRSIEADIRLDLANVSRRHAMVVGREGRFYAVDLGSTNTTSLNGAPLTVPKPLSAGDQLQIGDVKLRYQEG